MTPTTNPTKRLLFNSIGILISVIPVTVAIFSYFPLWIARDDASLISGISLLLICLAAVPLFRLIKQLFHSPSAPLMWFSAFVIFFFLSQIAAEVTVISLVGFISNLIGSLLFKIAKKYSEDKTDEGRT